MAEQSENAVQCCTEPCRYVFLSVWSVLYCILMGGGEKKEYEVMDDGNDWRGLVGRQLKNKNLLLIPVCAVTASEAPDPVRRHNLTCCLLEMVVLEKKREKSTYYVNTAIHTWWCMITRWQLFGLVDLLFISSSVAFSPVLLSCGHRLAPPPCTHIWESYTQRGNEIHIKQNVMNCL